MEGLIMLPILGVCLLIGWPVVLPLSCLTRSMFESGNNEIACVIIGAGTVLGAYFHYRIWVWVFNLVVALWKRL